MAATPPTSPTNGRRATTGGAGRSTPVLVPQGALVGQPDIPLNRSVTTVGSSETCRLVLQSRTISRHHAVFLVDGGTAFVADLASRTGVLVNGKAAREAELNSGDRIQIGKFIFRYRAADGPLPDATPIAPPASAVITGLLAIPLHGRIALIGRRETSDVALVGDNGVSAAHAALFHAGGQWYVRDLGSRTGTAVNGQPIVQQAVNFGDRIGVGAATIQFESAGAVPGHVATDVTPTIGLEPPAPLPTEPLPTELATMPLSLDEDGPSTDATPSMPIGLVAATDHPFAAVLTAADVPNAAADQLATDGALAGALPGTELPPEENPPLPQPRAWDAVDVNDPPLPATPVAELPSVPPEPKPRTWDDAQGFHANVVVDETPSGHGVAESLERPEPVAEAAPEPTYATVDESAIAPSTESVAGLGLGEPITSLVAESVPTLPVDAIAHDFHDDSAEPLDLTPVVVDEAAPETAPEAVPLAAEPTEWMDEATPEPEAEPVSFEPTPPHEEVAPLAMDRVEALPEEPVEVVPHAEAVAPAVDDEAWSPTDVVPVEAASAEWDEPSVSGSDLLPTADVVEATEPSPDSALAWDADVASEGEPAIVPALDESLSDSQFGRQMEEFVAADTTGPLVEALAPVAESAEHPEAPDVHPGLPTAETVAPPTPRSASFVPPADLLADVSDFVFVPGEATPAEDVIFWGDDEYDASAEFTTPSTFVAPPTPVDEHAAEPAAEPIADAEPVVEPVEESIEATEPSELEPVAEVSDAEPAPYAAEPYTTEPPVDVAAVVTDGAAEAVDELPVAEEIAPVDELPPDVAEPSEEPAEELAADPAHHFVAEGAEPVDELLVADEIAPADGVEPTAEMAEELATDDGTSYAEIAPVGEAELADDAAAVNVTPIDAAPFDAEPSVDLVDAPVAEAAADEALAIDDAVEESDAPLPVAAADSLSAGPFTAEPSIDLDSLTGDDQLAIDDAAGDPTDVLPAGDGDGPVAARGEANDDFFRADELALPAAESLESVATPWAPAEETDPSLAITTADEHPTAELPAIEPIAFGDLLEMPADVTTATAEHELSALPPPLPTSLPTAETSAGIDAWDEDDHTTASDDGHAPLHAVVATDEPVGFELESDGAEEPAADETASADWDDLDLLDAPAPAGEVAAGEPLAHEGAAALSTEPIEPPELSADGEASGFTADDAAAVVHPLDQLAAADAPSVPAVDYGAVLNVPDALVAGLSTTEALAPVTDFAAVGDGAPVDTFAAVTDAALTQPHAGSAVVDDDLAFLDFDGDDETSGFVTDEVSPPPLPLQSTADLPDDDLSLDTLGLDEAPIGEVAFDELPASELAVDELPLGEPVPSPDEAFAEVSDEVVPSVPPELVETVTEPTVDVAPPVEDPPLQLLASVSIPPPPEEPPARPPMSGPSLFGFNFEGGSFLGGMPLPLNRAEGAEPSQLPLPPEGIVFDQPEPGSGAPAEEGADDFAMAGASDDGVATDEFAVDSEGAPEGIPEGAVEGDTDEAGVARVRPTTPPPVGLIGLVAGQVDLPAPRPVLPVGLTGMGAAGVGGPSRVLPPPPVPPPGFADVGRSRSGDVFSQAAGPIGVVEAFGTRPGRVDQYEIPEVDRSLPPGTALATAKGDVAAPIVPPPAQRLPNAERLIPSDLPKRKKIRWLIGAFFIAPAIWGGLVYTSMSKTATVVGTLQYDGLDKLGESARRLFRSDQISRLCGGAVRAAAHEQLVNKGKPVGPTEDSNAMQRAMQENLTFTWDQKKQNLLTVTFKVSDGDVGKAQIEALLSALRANDESMSDARATASQELAKANADYEKAKADDEKLKAAWKEQNQLAQDRPDKLTSDALDRTLDAANKKVESVQAERAGTEAALVGWQKQDPSKPVDPAIDPEATNLRRQLAPIQAQIAKAKQLADMNGGSHGTGDDDPLTNLLLQQETRLKARLERREAELQRDSSFPPEERARQRETAIEQLSVKVAALKKAEADAAAAASTAANVANDAHTKIDAARVAEGRASDLSTQLMEANINLDHANTDLGDKQNAVNNTVVVAGSASTNPDVTVPNDNDPRPMTAGVGAGVIALLIVIWLLAVAGTGEELDPDAEYGNVDEERALPANARREQHRQPVGV